MKFSKTAFLVLLAVCLTSQGSMAAKGGDKGRPDNPGKPGGGGSTPPPTECPTTRPFQPADGTAFRTALACAVPGDTILLTPGTVYAGPFQLPYKDGTGWITIRSAAAEAAAGQPATNATTLPGSGVRVSPANAGAMPKIVAPAGSASPVLYTAAGAHHYLLVGIEFSTPQWLDALVLLGSNSESSTSQLPRHITVDRCYLHGSATEGTKHGLTANAGQGLANDGADSIVITNSYLADFKDQDWDAQAINVWNGWGPFRIENNYLEASGENLIFGGGDPTITDLIPSNITIRRNHFYKPTKWMTEAVRNRSTGLYNDRWVVKNLFELKNAKDVVVEANVFENNWIGADQHGFAIVFTPRNQDGRSPWSTIRNVRFENNVVKGSAGGFNLLGTDDIYRSGPLQDVIIRNNLLVDINPNPWAMGYTGTQVGRLFQVRKGVINLTVENNTGFHNREIAFAEGAMNSGFVFTNNVVRHNTCTAPYYNNCGISGVSTAPGNDTLQRYYTVPYVVTGNIMVEGGNAAQYPSGNEFPASVLFESNVNAVTGLPFDLNTSDYDVYYARPDGTKPGVSWSVVKSAITGVVQVYTQ